jgi:hypothetical protein
MREVRAAIVAIRTSGDAPASVGVPWCSATQYRAYPRRSASCASSMVLASARLPVEPEGTGDWSSTLNLGKFIVHPRTKLEKRRPPEGPPFESRLPGLR